MIRRRSSLVLLVTALVAVVLPTTFAASAQATTTASVSSSMSAQLGSAVQARRVALGRETLWTRTAFVSTARSYALALVSDTPPPSVAGTVSSISGQNLSAASAIDTLTKSMTALGSAVSTDAGWAIATNGTRLAAVIVIGAPDPALAAGPGCSTSGFCWQANGVDPHLPWTRNRLDWWLSTSQLPAGGEAVVKTAIARMNAISGLGVDLHYAGRTTATAPSSTRHFVIVFATSSRCGAGAWGCSEWQGIGPRQITESRIVLYVQHYTATPDPQIWAAIASHEIGHSLGLGHFDGVYAGRPQLMRSVTGSDNLLPGAGDDAGVRRLDPPGALTTQLTLPGALANGAHAAATVFTKSTGLGGIRRLRLDCTDRVTHAYRTVVSASGVWDIRAANRHLLWTVSAPTRYTAQCRAVVASKSRYVTSAPRSVVLG